MVLLEFSEFHYFDDILSDLKLTPVYIIELAVDDCTWTIQRRYSEFHELHDKLVALKRVDRALLPPKKLLWNQSKSFVEKRRQDLESYLQKLLDQTSYLPTPLLHFLEFDIYDIYGVSQALATELFDKAEAILSSDDVCEMTPMQLYAISERLQLAVPTCSADDSRSDIGHIMDFISRLKLMRVVGSRNRLGSSSRVVDQLHFDLSPFKALQHLQMDVCNTDIIGGLVELKKTLQYMAIHHTIKSIKEILLPEGEHWLNEEAGAVAGPSSSRPDHVPTWKCISRADFRYNSLTDVDDSVKLLPNLTRLDLSHNDLTEVNNLQYLSEMTHLDLSHNRLMSLEGLHTRLGNVTTLGLAANELSSLRGLGRLYSLVHLDVSKNAIEHMVEVNHISNLPCIESLSLKDNPITSVMDYRTKILSLFHEQYAALRLDGQRTSQNELDKVAIMKAIQKAKDTKVKKLAGKNSPSRKKHAIPVKQATIADPANSKLSLLSVAAMSAASSLTSSQHSLPQQDNISASSSDDTEYRAKVEEIRREGGEAWLSLLNEMRETPNAGPPTLKVKAGRHSPRLGRSPKAKRKENHDGWKPRSRSRSPAVLDIQQPPVSPTLKISPKGLLHCIFGELARHQMDCPTSVPELLFNLHIYFQGPVLSTYGPRHRRQNLPEPDAQGPSVVEYLLEHVTAEHRAEFVELLQGLTQGKVRLPSHIFPKQEDAAEVLTCMLRVLGLEQQMEAPIPAEPLKPVVDEMTKLTVNYEDSLEMDQADLGLDPSTDNLVRSASPAIIISEHPSPSVVKKHLRSATPRIIPTYDESTLENLAECNMQVGLQLTEPMQAIASMQPKDLTRFFHESIAEIGSEPERLAHVVWAGAIAFRNPAVEITACVMLSDRAVYILSADASSSQILSPPVDVRGHRRMKSDSSIKDKQRADSKGSDHPDTAGFNGGRILKQPHASGVLLIPAEDSDRKRVRCQHVLNLMDIVEVDVGLFDQKLRLTAETAEDTVSLLTRHFQLTLSFLERLTLVLPITSTKSKSPDRSANAMDPYKLHRAFTEEFLHPGSVKYSYANDETINDLTYLIVAFINDTKISMDNTSILLYMLVYQVHTSPLQGSPVTVREPLQECDRSQRTLVVTNQHLSLCREDHVSYPLPGFMKSLPDHPQYEFLEAQEIRNLRRLVVSDFSSRDVTLVFEVMDVVVDITMDYYGSKEGKEDVRPAMPEVAWTLVLPSMDDRERLRKQLCHTWMEIHGQELSIQVNT